MHSYIPPTLLINARRGSNRNHLQIRLKFEEFSLTSISDLTQKVSTYYSTVCSCMVAPKRTLMLVGSYHEARYRHDREPTETDGFVMSSYLPPDVLPTHFPP